MCSFFLGNFCIWKRLWWEIWSSHDCEVSDVAGFVTADLSAHTSVLEKHTIVAEGPEGREYVSPECWYLPANLYNDKIQKNKTVNICILPLLG
jgi:hypothetical protein